jgi:putative ABC transport system permease protein
VELPAPAETLRLPVVGVIRDLSNQMGTMILGRKTYIRAFQDDSVDVFRVYLQAGAALADVRRGIVDRLGRQRHLFVLSNREIRQYIGSVMNQWFGLTYLQVIVAMIVAILGIVNTLTVSISDRRRELGVLRAVGGLRSQIRGTVWMEAAAIGAIGLILGVAIGAINLYYELQVIQHDLTGIPLSYQFPVGIVMLLIPIILGSAFASAILPAETAVRSSLVEALEYE